MKERTQAHAYIAGWQAWMAGCDGRYTMPGVYQGESLAHAWRHGFVDAMEAEDGEDPEPECAGYGPHDCCNP